MTTRPAQPPAAPPAAPSRAGRPPAAAPAESAPPARAAAYAPGSVRHSLLVLGGAATAAVILLGLTDGPAAAGAGFALLTAAGLAVARYAAGGGAQDSGYRRAVRLLGSRAPALGEWEWIVGRGLGPESDLYFVTTVRPQLERLFTARLAERHGVDLRRRPARARALVGPELWPWIDPAAPPPAAALTEPVLRALLDRLEALDTPAPGAAPAHPATDSDPTTGHRDQAQ